MGKGVMSGVRLMNAEAPALQDWEVDHLRFTSFYRGEVPQAHVEGWWREIADSEERSVSLRPPDLMEHGPVGDDELALQWQGALKRVDWRLHQHKDETSPPAILSLGNLEAALERFTVFTDKWLASPTCPQSWRLALGAVLLLPVDTREEGYRILEPLLKDTVKLDPAGSSEFTYSINRRCKSSTIEGLQINRLGKWFVWVWQTKKIEVRGILQDGSPTPIVQQSDLGPKRLACRVDLDINTMPEYEGEFDTQAQRDILEELRALAVEMAERGDVP